MDSMDLSKDPHFMRNHLATHERMLCLTLHTNEHNYLAHTQGKRTQEQSGQKGLPVTPRKKAFPPRP